MRNSINIDGKKIQLKRWESGLVLPVTSDVFELVGLGGLCTMEGIDGFFNLIGNNPEAAIKLVCYECDLTQLNAQEYIKRYFIIDCGIRLTKTVSPDLRENDFELARYYLESLFDVWYTRDDILEMLNMEGFNIEIKYY